MRRRQGRRDDLACVREMVEQTAGRSVGRVDRAEEPPGLGQKLPDRRRLEFSKERSSVDAPEVGEVPVKVEFLGNDRVPARLLEVESGRRDKVSGREEVRHLVADVKVDLVDHLGYVPVVVEVDAGDASADVLANLGGDGRDGLVELLLDDHAVEEPGQEDLLVLRRIGVIGARRVRDERVELSEHEAESETPVESAAILAEPKEKSTEDAQQHTELVPGVGQVDEDDPLDQPASDALVLPILRHTEHDPKLASKVGQALLARLEAVGLEPSEKQLDSVGQERVVLLTLNEPLEDFEIGRVDERLEDEHERNHVLVLPPCEPKRCPAGREVVHRVGARRLVWSDTPDLRSKRRVPRTSLGEGRSEERDDVVSSGEDEESDELFVSVDEEVSSVRRRLLRVLDELLGRGRLEVAPVRLHKRHKMSDKVSRSEPFPERLETCRTLTMTGRCPNSRISSCSSPPLTLQMILAVILDL